MGLGRVRQLLWMFFHFGVACVYIGAAVRFHSSSHRPVIHAVVLFVMVVTLNVSLNSNNNSLFVVCSQPYEGSAQPLAHL